MMHEKLHWHLVHVRGALLLHESFYLKLLSLGESFNRRLLPMRKNKTFLSYGRNTVWQGFFERKL